MLIVSPDPKKKKVVDYDFTFAGGTTLPISVDAEAGDVVSFDHNPLAIVITLSAKPSLTNPAITLPEEEITIFQSQLLAIQKRTRLVEEMTVEQKEMWEQFVKGASPVN